MKMPAENLYDRKVEMATDESLEWVIDWWLPKEEFRHLIDGKIQEAVKGGKVLALPIQMEPGQVYIDLLTLLQSQVHCGACDASCCRRNPHDEPFQILPSEYRRLAKKYGGKHFTVDKGITCIPMPCPFLENNRCTIYEDRPLICVFYPFQPGAIDSGNNKMLALAADCPEARRITRQVYMSAWWIRHQFRLIEQIKSKWR